MLYLKQSTASQSILLGPFVDDTDGATPETGLTIANTDIRLSKNGGNMAAKNSGGGTHDENGYYTITLDATDTNTVGRLQISCKVTGALSVWTELQVLEENVYDAWFGTSAAAGTDLAAILTDTAEIGTAGAGLTDLGGMSTAMKAEVNAEALDVIATDTIAELAQGAPAATPTVTTALMALYMALRNKVDVTSTTKEIHNDAGTVIFKKALTDDGTTYSEAEAVTGP